MRVSDKDVVILSGGQGTRLRSAVGTRQKTMAQIHDRPFLDYLVRYLEKCGFKRLVICTGYQAADLQDYFAKHTYACACEFSQEEAPLGTGGAIKNAERLIRTDPFFVLNGDSFCKLDYAGLLDSHLMQDALATIAVTQVLNAKDYGAVDLSEEKWILGFQEKQVNAAPDAAEKIWVNAGVYCFSREMLSCLPAGQAASLERDIFPKVLARGVAGYITTESFMDIGTPERYEEAKKILE